MLKPCSTKPRPINPNPKFIMTLEVLLKPLSVKSMPVTGMMSCWSPPVTGIGRVGTVVGVAVSVGVGGTVVFVAVGTVVLV